ncbi:MAG: glycine C-acetyltransferase [Hyphomicrobiales bacterium]|nr:glycine C-acetyltransferase [Hyphomicrobiales bacterium]MDE2017646.1 glycine C-acetyltransferase [Hyphomicrobiales bacterium]
MTSNLSARAAEALAAIESEGLLKREREIGSPQGARVTVVGADGRRREAINLCANNYLGLANHPEVVAAAKAALDEEGFGMASVRFICGAQTGHRALERRIADYLGKEDAILFAACFDANGGLFEALLGEGDAIVSDSLNHASIIDGVRLSKAKRHRFPNGDMDGLESALKAARADGAKTVLIATDGVFSMDGHFARLADVAALAERYGAATMVDDCHATGFIGPQGRGTPHRAGVAARVDVLTGTLGKALGGAMGGYVAASRPVIELLRQRARPYLFSNSLAPAIVAGSMKAIDLAEAGDDLRAKLFANAARFRAGLEAAGFRLLPGETPIVPVMLGEADKAQALARALDARGVFVAGFVFPVVPRGQARVRTQVTAAHSEADLDEAIAAFAAAGRETGAI